MIDDVGRWDDINELRKSNPNMGVSVSVDYLLEEIAIAEGSLSKRAEFICKYGCVKQNASQAWLSTTDVEKCAGPALSLENFRGSYCVGGIDLSQTTDLTSCCVVIEKGGKNYIFSHFFLPAERIDDAIERDGVPYRLYMQAGWMSASGENYVDYKDCFEWFRRLVEEFEIYPLQIGYDRYSAQYLVQDMSAYGFHMDDVFQGTNLTPVIQETEGLIRDGAINIGDNQLLKMHMLDSALKVDAATGRRKLIKLNRECHIDGMAALLDAMCVKQKWYGQYGEQLRNEE
jgi:phage terminase large subunit-like protein